MEEKITTIFSAHLHGKRHLNFLGSLGLDDPEVVPYCLWKEKL